MPNTADEVVLWHAPQTMCVFKAHDRADRRFQVYVVVDGKRVVDQLFDDNEHAAEFAIEQMHAYAGASSFQPS